MNFHGLILRSATLALALVLAATGRAADASIDARSYSTAVDDATAIAARHEGAAVFRVSGTSMLPFFGDGALLVMKPIPAARLRTGMVVVYQNRFGETVAHRLVEGSNQGWRVQGYNNEQADSTRVDASNLRGVVYAILHPRSLEAEAGQESSNPAMASIPVALAAAAR